MREIPTHRLTGGTAGRIVELLRHEAMTVDELAERLSLTRTAVRAQITSLMGRGFVEPRGFRKGPSKPARVFGVTAEAEQQISQAYVPVLTHLLRRLSLRMNPGDFEELLQEVGKSLGRYAPAHGSVRERVDRANRLLHELGGLTSLTEEGEHLVITGQGCPLAAATAEFPQACSIIANILAEVTGLSVTTRCEEFGRKRCCFELVRGAA